MKAEEWLLSEAIVAAFPLQEALACLTNPTHWLQGGLRISLDLFLHLQFHDDSENSENSRARRRDCELPIETFISQASSVCLVITATPLLYTSYCGL